MTVDQGYDVFASIVIVAVFGVVILPLIGIDPSGYIDLLPGIVIFAFVIGIAVMAWFR